MNTPSKAPAKWNFSMRALLVMMAITSLTIVIHQRHTQVNGIVRRFEKLGGKIEYHPDPIPGLGKLTGNFFSDVRAIDLKRTQVTDDDLKGINKLGRLERLYLPGTSIGRAGLKHLAANDQLRGLSLWGCPNINNAFHIELSQLKRLEVLDIHDTSVTGNGIRHVRHLRALKHLIFSTSSKGYPYPIAMTTEDIDALDHVRATPVGRLRVSRVDTDDVRQVTCMDLSRSPGVRINRGSAEYLASIDLHATKSTIFSIAASDRAPPLCEFAKKLSPKCEGIKISYRNISFQLDANENGNKATVTYHDAFQPAGSYFPMRRRWTVSTVTNLLEYLPHLKRLSLDFHSVAFNEKETHAKLFEEIAKLPKLEKLAIENSKLLSKQLTVFEITSLTSLPNLRSASFFNLEEEAVDFLRNNGFNSIHKLQIESPDYGRRDHWVAERK